MMELYKYQGAGNDFLIADNRDGRLQFSKEQIAALCDRRYGIGADGIMLLGAADEGYDFRMDYYNSDGSGGMMCGNGGRCIVAFADRLRVKRSIRAEYGIKTFGFIAPDGPHIAFLRESDGYVRLKMKDIKEIVHYPELGGWFLDTGTRHFVKFVDSLKDFDVFENGRRIRYNSIFAPVGTNANFMEACGDVLCVRTYEKGVEGETCACGTGITASAIAAWHAGSGIEAIGGVFRKYGSRIGVDIRALHDSLGVDFIPTKTGAEDVYLTGPATFVAKIII